MDTASTDAIDLSNYHLVHRGLRWGARRMAVASAEVQAGDRRRGAALARWCRSYIGELHCHHTIEDDVCFPALVERVPVAASLIGRTDDDHHVMDELVARLAPALTALEAGRPAGSLTATLTELADHLDVHLDFEDTEVLPLFERHFTVEEYQALEEQAIKVLGLSRQALFTVPFILSVATPEELAVSWSGAPLPFKLLYRASRGRYARLTEAALGSADLRPHVAA